MRARGDVAHEREDRFLAFDLAGMDVGLKVDAQPPGGADRRRRRIRHAAHHRKRQRPALERVAERRQVDEVRRLVHRRQEPLHIVVATGLGEIRTFGASLEAGERRPLAGLGDRCGRGRDDQEKDGEAAIHDEDHKPPLSRGEAARFRGANVPGFWVLSSEVLRFWGSCGGLRLECRHVPFPTLPRAIVVLVGIRRLCPDAGCVLCRASSTVGWSGRTEQSALRRGAAG